MPRQFKHFHATGYWAWIKVFRKLPLNSTTKLVGYALATNADFETGEHAHPGVTLLMDQTGLTSDRTVRKALENLREMGLVFRRVKGSRAGRRGLADEYCLSLHDEARIAAGRDPCDCKEQTAAEKEAKERRQKIINGVDPWAGR